MLTISFNDFICYLEGRQFQRRSLCFTNGCIEALDRCFEFLIYSNIKNGIILYCLRFWDKVSYRPGLYLSIMYSRITLNYLSFCYYFPSSGMAGICHHASLKKWITILVYGIISNINSLVSVTMDVKTNSCNTMDYSVASGKKTYILCSFWHDI